MVMKEILRQGLGLDENTVLGFVGEARVKKGLAVLLNAFAQVADVRPAHMVLVGGVRDKDSPILDLFRRQHPDLSLQVIPYLDHEQLPGVYNALDLLRPRLTYLMEEGYE